jgi:capsular polysaccharide biosynthesis protein
MYDASRSALPEYPPPAETEDFFSIADLARAVMRRLWMVVLIALLAAAAAVAVSLLQPPTYEASAMVVVSPKEGASAQENISNRIAGLQVLAHEMAVAGLNRSMVEGVVRAQSGPGPKAVSTSEVRENLTVAQVEDTRFLSISYTSGDRKQAQAVANTAARVFVERAPAASEMATDASVGVSAYAPPPQALEGPNPARSGVLAAVLGLMGGVGPRLPAGALLGRLGLAGGGRAGLGRAQFRRRSGVRPGKEQEGRIRGVGSIRHEFGRVGRAPRQRS